jgi:hypothetical protein
VEANKQKETSETVAEKDKTITVHGFYNVCFSALLMALRLASSILTGWQFPRVIIYLEPETLQLSEACTTFLSKTKASTEREKEEFLKKFFARFGKLSLPISHP